MRKFLDRFLEYSVVILLSVMLFSVLWGVATRYIFADQSSWTDELARFMLIWVSIVGATYVSSKNQHITIDLLPKQMKEESKLWLDVFVSVIIILFVVAVFLIGGFRYVYISFYLGQKSAALEIPMGFVYGVLPVCGMIIIYFKLLAISTSLKLIRKI